MISLGIVVATLAFLQFGRVCSVSHLPQVVSLSVDYGSFVTLPCNGSAYLEEGLPLEEGEESEFRWEAVGSDVAFVQSDGELVQGRGFEGRVALAPGYRRDEGDWSLFLSRVRLTDADMYECLRGRRTVSTVWLTVNELSVETSVTAWLGDALHLPCVLSVYRSQSPTELSVWWLRNDQLLVSYNQSSVTIEDEDASRFTVDMGRTVEEFVLYVDPVLYEDQGQYRCFYKTSVTEGAKPGFPEITTVTVLGQEATAAADTETEAWTDNMTTSTETDAWTDNMTTSTETETDAWAYNMSTSTATATEGQTTGGTAAISTTAHPTPVFLDLLTHAEQVGTTPRPMEAQEETVTSFPEEEGSLLESIQWDSLPWVRIGLIAGVLVVTAVTLCVLGSLRKI